MIRIKRLQDTLEISDVIVDYDPVTLCRRPVGKQQAIRLLSENLSAAALEIINKIPERDGYLDEQSVDEILLRSHYEMQRISELFEHGWRVASVLCPLVNVIRSGEALRSEPPAKLRIVDVGCGTGFVVRWLAAHRSLGDNVEVVGVDYNQAFINEARRLAANEGLQCTFEAANAFKLSVPANIFISTGVLHHFRDNDLLDFFRNQNQPQTLASIHFDFQQNCFGPFGSWLFHSILMREPLAKHDGVLSACRAHSSQALLEAARGALPQFASTMYNSKLWRLPIPRIMHAVLSVRPELKQQLIQAFGGRAHCALGSFD